MTRRSGPSENEQVCAYPQLEPGWYCCTSCGSRLFWVYHVRDMEIQVKCKCGLAYHIVVGDVKVER